jgi:predicted dehydrogenase
MLNWGVIGLGNVAKRFCKSLAHSDLGRLYTVASHSNEKCEAFAKAYHPTKVYHDYESLFNDEEVDVVYVAVPHGLHYEVCKEALSHYKCVLCEKPAFLTKKEAVEITSLANEHMLFFMEAMKTRFMPLIKVIRKNLADGMIGDIVSIENRFFSEVEYDPRRYLFDPKQGGALYDTGVYGLASLFDFVRTPVTSMEKQAEYAHGVDVYDRVTLTFENGVTGVVECALNRPRDRRQIIKGTKGSIIMDPYYRPKEATVNIGEESYTLTAKIPFDDFYPQIEAVHQDIEHLKVEDPLMSFKDTIYLSEMLEKIKDLKS